MDFLPSNIKLLMNLVTVTDWKFGSGGTSLCSALERRLMLLGPLGAVLRPRLATVAHARRVQRAADDVVAHARQILHTAAPDEHDRVLLEVVPLARDVRRHFVPVGQTHTGHLPKRRVRLLRRG